ncbi:hypothetical protein M378DRAFT_183327 [Amanita muscaria Koide BX008]|uniref:Uncharacterized protein n=1 Tax=Amanita muscaria (strain Koide BX008) TaxID=946122 RepID=A0A0C2TTT5_AMAMK|nr:hypothetical protein M378DRAFT_183327 [Amanita muscaria Koide BX008]
MGKAQKKTGKGRLDKYYKLAKEQGYRARSAFKLIQLNKKYGFLEGSRCCIDLCAAPGGWLQVASKYMPVNSLIVGVDLVSIKPIPHVATFAADITTPQCRNLLRNELKDWKADVVLHDGAPNVGTAWVQDAYTQSELVLMSLKLAVEFLIKGGTFITKVFRSVDYNNLIWVFNQLFGKVEATKPPSSRNVSAEIFVVCRDFLAPKHIDPKFLDPRHVFKDLAASIPSEKGTSANDVQANVFHPEKKRRHRDGYAEGDYTLFRTVPASDFIKGSDPVALLGSYNKIAFTTDEEKQWLTLQITTEDVKANCEDLKVLGKGDFKTLMKWRLALRQELGLEVKAKETEEFTETAEVTEEVDDDQQIQEELERLGKEAEASAKRARRRANELKTRTIQRMQLQMTAPLDIGLEQEDAALHMGQEDIFDLSATEKAMRRKRGVELLTENDGEGPEEESNDEDGLDLDNGDDDGDSDTEREKKVQGLEAELDGMYDAYRNRLREKDPKFKVREMREKNKAREEWHGIKEKESDDEDEDTAEESSDEGGWDVMEENKMRFSDESSDSGISEDEGEELQKRKRTFSEGLSGKPPKRQRLITDLQETKRTKPQAAKLWFSRDVFAGEGGLEVESDEEQETDHLSNEGEGDDDVEIVPQESDSDDGLWDINEENEDEVKTADIKRFGLFTPEAATLAQQLVNREKTKTQLINDGFNRYSLNSKEGLPSWFLDDEAKYYKTNIPISKEAVDALRAKQRALDARPIKKIAEAKARKKFKAAQRLEKAMKKAEGVNETTELTEREKARQIEKLMRNSMSSGKTKKEVKLVVAKGPHKGIKGRPKGVKGRYTMVDARMRKEV